MADPVSIGNLALAHLGDQATVSSIDPPDGSEQAERLQQFYPIARDTLLEARPWGFATARATLTALAANPTAWAYAYALPSDLLAVQDVQPAGAHDFPPEGGASDAVPYVVEGDVLYCDQPSAVLRYTRAQPDTSVFPPSFVDCLSWLLASYLAGPILRGEAGRSAGEAAYEVYLARLDGAATKDARQRRATAERPAPWLAGR